MRPREEALISPIPANLYWSGNLPHMARALDMLLGMATWKLDRCWIRRKYAAIAFRFPQSLVSKPSMSRRCSRIPKQMSRMVTVSQRKYFCCPCFNMDSTTSKSSSSFFRIKANSLQFGILFGCFEMSSALANRTLEYLEDVLACCWIVEINRSLESERIWRWN